MALDSILLLGAIVLLVAIGSSRLGARLGLPALILFLAIGMGVASLGFPLKDADLAHALGFAALVVILYEGGITTRWQDIQRSLPMATLLATVGVLVSIFLVGAFGYIALGMPLSLALLFGAITAPTDSAAVFSVLRRVPLPARLRATLEAESGLNDAPVVLLVSAATSLAVGTSHVSGLPVTLVLIVGEFLGGIALGVALGWLGAMGLRRIALPSSGLYPLAAMAWAVFAYGIGTTLHLSGFAAVYTCAVVLGNASLPHRMATRSFAEGLGWVAQIGLFVMLGLLANPAAITLGEIGFGIAAGLFLTFVARPVSVFVCAVWFRMPWREQAFLSWAGLRGAVPIILATVPMAAGLTGSGHLFNVVIVFVVVFTLPDGSHLAGLEIIELRLPRTAVVSLIVRDGESIVPAPTTRIMIGDALLIVTSKQVRVQTEERLRVLGRGGRLARWNHASDTPAPRPRRMPKLFRLPGP
jgi:cell volume regulation protein A